MSRYAYDKNTGTSTLIAGASKGGIDNVDDQLSTTSENPVQNKVITNALEEMKTEIGQGELPIAVPINPSSPSSLANGSIWIED
jgi:hypothetical protein